MKKQNFVLYLCSAYCVFTVIQNIFEMKTIGTESLAIVGGGILVSWITFMINDIVTEVYGKETSIKVFVIAGILNTIIVILAQLLIALPGSYEEQNIAFAQIFSNSVRTTLASLTAFYIGNYINMKVMLTMKGDKNNEGLFGRAVVSTVLGQFTDNMLFVTIAFAPIGLSAFEMTWVDILTSVIGGTCIETLVESIFVPIITIPVAKKLKEIED